MFRGKGTTVEAVLTSLFPSAKLRETAVDAGVLTRRRKVDPVAFFWTLVLGFGVAKQRTLAGLRRTYENRTSTKIEESSFYDRFTPRTANWLRGIVGEALERVATDSRRLADRLSGFRDLLLIDSTVIRLHDLLKGSFAGCRTNHTKAAAKLHVVMSVKDASPARIRLTPERTNDRSPWRRVGGWVRDTLMLFDLGYFGYALFTRIDENGGFFISRLKGNANPKLVAQNRQWRGRSKTVVGQKLRDAVVGLQREVLDVDVEVSFNRRVYAGQHRRAARHAQTARPPVGEARNHDLPAAQRARRRREEAAVGQVDRSGHWPDDDALAEPVVGGEDDSRFCGLILIALRRRIVDQREAPAAAAACVVAGGRAAVRGHNAAAGELGAGDEDAPARAAPVHTGPRSAGRDRAIDRDQTGCVNAHAPAAHDSVHSIIKFRTAQRIKLKTHWAYAVCFTMMKLSSLAQSAFAKAG